MNIQQQALAIAALLQHCRLVDQLAQSGSVDVRELEFCLRQLFIFEYDDANDAFGDTSALEPGLRVLINLLERRNSNEANQNVLHYAVALIHLERKLSANKNMLQIIRSRLDHAHYRSAHFESDSHALADSIAGIYQDTLSTLKYRIHVKGNMQHLQDEHTANCIRAVLLCAVRAVRIWRSMGGSRLRLIMNRGAYHQEALAQLNL